MDRSHPSNRPRRRAESSARLSKPARATLEAAAVIGFHINPSLLEAVGAPETVSVDECLAAGVLVVEGDGLRFRHDIARDSILEAMWPIHGRSTHASVLAALRSTPDARLDAALLTHHAEAAGDWAAVLEFAPIASRRAAGLRAHREAAAQYDRVLPLAAALPEIAQAELLEAAAIERYLANRGTDAVEAQEAALVIRKRIGDRRKEGQNLRWLSRHYWANGQNAEAVPAVQTAIEILEPEPPGAELAMAYSSLSQLRMLSEETQEAVHWGELAIALVERIDDAESLCDALNNVGTARHKTGDEQGRLQIERSLEIALANGFEEHAGRA